MAQGAQVTLQGVVDQVGTPAKAMENQSAVIQGLVDRSSEGPPIYQQGGAAPAPVPKAGAVPTVPGKTNKAVLTKLFKGTSGGDAQSMLAGLLGGNMRATPEGVEGDASPEQKERIIGGAINHNRVTHFLDTQSEQRETSKVVVKDAHDQPPAYDLDLTFMREVISMGAVPLRIEARWANALLFAIWKDHKPSSDWVRFKDGGWKKDRNRVEAATLARTLDLMLMEKGWEDVQDMAGMEVLLRRLHAIFIADTTGNWGISEVLEEVPGPNTPAFHDNICTNMMNRAVLLHKYRNMTASGKVEKDGD
jgi:hypothetical protein